MKFKNFLNNSITYLFIILLIIHNVYITCSKISSTKKSHRFKNSHYYSKESFNTKKSQTKIFGFGRLFNYVCSKFGCSSNNSTEKILKDSVNLKSAMLSDILERSNYQEKDFKAYTVMKISSFLGVLPPHLLEGAYIPIIKNYIFCFIDEELKNEKNKLTRKMKATFRAVFILQKLKKLSNIKKSEKKLDEKFVDILTNIRINKKALDEITKVSKEENIHLVKFLARNSLLFANKNTDNIPENIKLLTFSKSNDEFLHGFFEDYLHQFSECKTEKFSEFTVKFINENFYNRKNERNSIPDKEENQRILEEVKTELIRINTIASLKRTNKFKNEEALKLDSQLNKYLQNEKFRRNSENDTVGNFKIKESSKHKTQKKIRRSKMSFFELNSSNLSPVPVEYTEDSKKLEETKKDRLLAISETLDSISKKSKQLKDISQTAADTLKKMKEGIKMIQDLKDFFKNDEILKDIKYIQSFIEKLESWKITKSENLTKLQEILTKYESKANSVKGFFGSIFNYSSKANEIIKGIQSIMLTERPSLIISKCLILSSNIATIIPGLSSYEYAISAAKYIGETIRDTNLLQDIIDDVINKYTKDFEYSLSMGFYPFQTFIHNDFAPDYGSESLNFEDLFKEIGDVRKNVSEELNKALDPIVKQIDLDRSEGRLDRYTVMIGGDFANDVIDFGYENASSKVEKGISENFRNWFSSHNSLSEDDNKYDIHSSNSEVSNKDSEKNHEVSDNHSTNYNSHDVSFDKELPQDNDTERYYEQSRNFVDF